MAHSPHHNPPHLQNDIERYHALIESVQDYAIYFLDSFGYIESWNNGATSITGYDSSAVIGKHFSILFVPNDIQNLKPEKELLKAARKNHCETEDWRIKSDGTRFWVNCVTTALFNQEHILIGYAVITKDITEKKIARDALTVANGQLKKQRTELEALNNVKDEFISLASHQLRTPATGIKQYLGLLLEGFAGEISSEQRTFIEKAYKNNERQIDLVNNLLRTAQIDAGAIKLRKTDVSVPELIHEVVDIFQDLFNERKQTIHVDVDSSVTKIYIDKDHMRMVLENLIDNASKYTDTGGTIDISVNETKTYLEICVKDSGVGIAAQDIDKVFEKFHRIPNRLSENVGGTGLGLYWTKKLISLHKGTIRVSSTINQGTEFTIVLPKGDSNA